MKVILLKDVDHLGRTGDVKEVAPGYARNFLLRRGLVAIATPGQMKRLDQLRAQRAKEDQRRLSEAQQLAERLRALEVTIPARVGEQGRLFGSVTTQDIAAALKEQHGVEIDRRDLEQEDPIRTLGTHTVAVRLGGSVHGQVRVTVVEEGRPAGESAAPAPSAPIEEAAAPA